MKRSTARRWITLAVTLATMQLGSVASASCIYNHTAKTLSINLACGLFCGNEWRMHPEEHKCRGGTGGLVTVNGGYPKHSSYLDQVFIHVEDHGYVTVRPGWRDQGPSWNTVCSYRQDHSVRECRGLLAPN